MKKINLLLGSLLIGLFVISLASCATAEGYAVVTGVVRPETNAEDVKLYTEIPESCEVIGIVTASSGWGWTRQGSMDYAMAELKKQAAKLGANGIVIENINQVSSVSRESVSGKAIYIAE